MTNWKGPALSAPVTIWLLLAFAAPMIVVVLLSLQPSADPFAPLLTSPSLAQFMLVASDGFYYRVLLETVLIGLAVTLVSALLGYPVAYWLARMPVRWRALAFAVILIPLLTNVVVRSLGVMLLLSPDGLINSVLKFFWLPTASKMLFTHFAVIVGLAQVFMPFMVIALYDSMQSTSPRVHEAAESLGAGPAMRFLSVDLPLSFPGLRSGAVIVFLMSTTAYVSATLLGGKKVWTMGMLVVQEAVANLNAPIASALAIVMTVMGLVFAAVCSWWIGRMMPWRSDVPSNPLSLPGWAVSLLEAIGPTVSRILLAASIGLLLLPLWLVVVQSVNDVPLATAAGFRGFTLKWYEQVLFGGTYTEAFLVSAKLAIVAVMIALAIGLPAAFALARYPFRGRGLLLVFWMLPLSLPQIAVGVGMLKLLQIYFAVPAFLGLVGIHVVIVLPFVIALLTTSVQSLDRAQEEAADSLGAGPVRRLLLVTLPALTPGLFAAGVIGFLMSFGEVTVTAFLTTARMVTLPVRIYSEVSSVLEPTAHAISAVLIFVTILTLWLVGQVVRLDKLYAR